MLGMQQSAYTGNADALKAAAYQQQAYNNASNAIAVPPAPRTIVSAISRMEGLNERLSQTHATLAHIADMLGALRSVPGKEAGGNPAASGAISRLNDSADAAHAQLSDIEALLQAISGALG